MTEKSPKKIEKQAKTPEKIVFTEGIDFYIENGLYVFTENYLKERGYCCESGCRHCPYKKLKINDI
jgi:Family of unknown function (DUF5522)